MMTKKYPRYSRYMDDDTVDMLAELAYQATVKEHKRVSESEIIRRLIRAEYERLDEQSIAVASPDAPEARSEA